MNIFRKILVNSGVGAVALLPYVVLAQDLNAVVNKLTTQLNSIPGLLVGLAIILFLWGVLKYIMAGSEGDVKEAVQMILWGLVAIFVMLSVWGLVNVLSGTIGIGTGGGKISPPQI